MAAESLETTAAPIGASAVATTTAQPVIAEQPVLETGEGHGAPGRLVLDA